jgi:hypothetical membrane protein
MPANPEATVSNTRARRGDDCTPAARVTKSLFGYGVIAGPFYVLASLIDGATRRGFSFTRDSWSVLSLGPRGWIHITVFILTGLMVVAAALALRRHLEPKSGRSAWVLLALYGLMLVLAGVFRPDPTGGSPTLPGLLHLAAGGLGFVAFAISAFIVARRFLRRGDSGWGWFSIVAGVLLLGGFVAIASGKPSSFTVPLFTAAVIVSWGWLSAVSVRFYREADARGRADAALTRTSLSEGGPTGVG